MGHTIGLVPYINGEFVTGISDASSMSLMEEEEKIYIYWPERKPNFYHATMTIEIVTSLKLELLRDPGDMRVVREREMRIRQMRESKIWAQILGKKSIQHLPAIVQIGADQNDNKDDVKKEILKRVNEKEQRVKEEIIEIQLRGLRFPAQMNDHRWKMSMTVMVHRMRYSEVTNALFRIGGKEATKNEFTVMYDIQIEDIRVNKENAEERYTNAYLSQVKYYLNRVIFKVVGLPKKIDMETLMVGPEDHGGKGRKTLKQLIMEDATYIKESRVEYSNPVRKVQRVMEGGGWKITGMKQC